MKNKNKMFLSLGGLWVFGILYQIFVGNEGGVFIAGILLCGIGFGWYACKTKEEEKKCTFGQTNKEIN